MEKEERIKELEDMMFMLNNYEILATRSDIYYLKGAGSYTITWDTEYEVYLRRTEYSKIMLITYDGKTIDKTYDHEYDDKMLSCMGIDYDDIVTIKQAIVDELMCLGAEKVL